MENSKFNPAFGGTKLQFKIKNFRFYILFLIFAFCILDLSGCGTIKEAAKGIAGLSTKEVEDTRKEAIKKEFNCDYNTCYNKVKEILKERNSYIYAEDAKKHMIAVYASEEDTAPVGIFLEEKLASTTQVEVSSPSTYAKEFISKRIFLGLEKLLEPGEKEGQRDEKK